jgi:hypothetical protein
MTIHTNFENIDPSEFGLSYHVVVYLPSNAKITHCSLCVWMVPGTEI